MKELPWFKYNTGQYLTGEITTCSYETQGIFANICCYYWNKAGNYFLDIAKKRFPVNIENIDELIELDIMKVDEDGKLVINFLDEQLVEKERVSKRNAVNGRKGGKTPSKQPQSEKKATASKEPTDLQVQKSELFETFWDKYDKKVGDKKAVRKSFMGISIENIEKIFSHIPLYKEAQPDKKYRKNPSSYLYQKAWNDEVIDSGANSQGQAPKITSLKM
jgi:hypothetical protein